MNLAEAKQVLHESIKSGSEPPIEIINFILSPDSDLREEDRRELAYLCARALLPYDINLFWRVARIIYPSFWYIDVLSYAIGHSLVANVDWREFYKAGIQAIRDMPLGFRSLSYITLAKPISDISRAYSYDLIQSSVKTLPFSYTSVFGGTAIQSAQLFVKIGFEVERNIRVLTNIVNATLLLTPIYKIDVLSKVAIYVDKISKDLMLEVIGRCFNLFKYLGPKSLMEAQAIMTNTLVSIFYDDFEPLLDISKELNHACRETIKHAIIRILQDKERKPFYEIDLEKYGDPRILELTEDTIKKKKILRRRLSESLEKTLLSSLNK